MHFKHSTQILVGYRLNWLYLQESHLSSKTASFSVFKTTGLRNAGGIIGGISSICIFGVSIVLVYTHFSIICE